MADYIPVYDRFGRLRMVEAGSVKGINAAKLESKSASEFKQTGASIGAFIEYAYRVQGNIALNTIDYSLYVMDGAGTITLTLPATVERGTEITFMNPTKGTFVINGNGVKIVKSGSENTSISLAEYQSIKLKYLDVGQDHTSLWYELVTIPVGVGGYVHPSTHPASMIEQDSTHRFITDTQIGSFHAPGSDNQDLSNYVQTNDARLSDARPASDVYSWAKAATKPAYTHIETGAEKAFTAKLTVGEDKPTGANVTPVTLGISFNYEANKKYVIDIYAIVKPSAATTGCGFLIDTSSVVTYAGTFTIHQLAATGTVSGGSSIGDLGATAMGVSSGMAGTGDNFVYGGGLLITGANAGTATFFFRSETTAITTCKAGTFIRVMEV